MEYLAQKVFEINDEQKLKPFYDSRMAQEVPADSLGDEWKVFINPLLCIIIGVAL